MSPKKFGDRQSVLWLCPLIFGTIKAAAVSMKKIGGPPVCALAMSPNFGDHKGSWLCPQRNSGTVSLCSGYLP